MKKIQLKVDIHSDKSKTDLLKVVSKLEGVDQILVEKEKGMLTIVGSVDPVLLTKKIRKAKKHAEIISVGPPKKPNPKPDSPDSSQNYKPFPLSYYHYPAVVVSYDPYDNRLCNIL